MAMSTRWRIPPDISKGYCLTAGRVGDADRVKQLDRSGPCGLAAHLAMAADTSTI